MITSNKKYLRKALCFVLAKSYVLILSRLFFLFIYGDFLLLLKDVLCAI